MLSRSSPFLPIFSIATRSLPPSTLFFFFFYQLNPFQSCICCFTPPSGFPPSPALLLAVSTFFIFLVSLVMPCMHFASHSCMGPLLRYSSALFWCSFSSLLHGLFNPLSWLHPNSLCIAHTQTRIHCRPFCSENTSLVIPCQENWVPNLVLLFWPVCNWQKLWLNPISYSVDNV